MTMPSIELNTATTVATARLRMVVITTCCPSDRCLIHSLSSKMIRNAMSMSKPVPISIHIFLLTSLFRPIFSQMMSLESVRGYSSTSANSLGLAGFMKKMITLPEKLALMSERAIFSSISASLTVTMGSTILGAD
jgi:hypothetical protein